MPKNIKTLFLLLMGMLLLVFIIDGFYSSADVEGRIVDEETGEPIEGAVVVGIWQLESQGFEHYYGDAIHVVESVTDAEGRYRLEGFALKWVGHLGGRLMDRDPKFSVYAVGYQPTGAGRDISEPGRGFRRISPLNGQDIGLKRKALDDRFIANIWSSSIQKINDAGSCAVTQLPSLRTLLNRIEPQYDRLLKEGYGLHETPYKNAVERCNKGRRQ